jgi:hypothetical protein
MIVLECREALRRLRRRPGYALLSVAVLGVGLGVVLFLFGLINTLILEPLPVPHPARVMALGEPSHSGNGIAEIDSDQYLALRGHLRSIDLMGAYVPIGVGVDMGNGATYYPGSRMTASMMPLLGIEPLLGRTLLPADDAAGAPDVALLGETLWRNSFKADPHIVGRAVRVNGDWVTVVGVVPAQATSMPVTDNQVWLPLKLQPGQHRDLWSAARLAPGQQLAQARAELDAWGARLQAALPMGKRTRGIVIKPWKFSFVPEDMRHWVWLMFGAAVLVLLLACVNVANLQLVQTLQRRCAARWAAVARGWCPVRWWKACCWAWPRWPWRFRSCMGATAGSSRCISPAPRERRPSTFSASTDGWWRRRWPSPCSARPCPG